jgi:hypothetical protein
LITRVLLSGRGVVARAHQFSRTAVVAMHGAAQRVGELGTAEDSPLLGLWNTKGEEAVRLPLLWHLTCTLSNSMCYRSKIDPILCHHQPTGVPRQSSGYWTCSPHTAGQVVDAIMLPRGLVSAIALELYQFASSRNRVSMHGVRNRTRNGAVVVRVQLVLYKVI